LIGKPCPEGLLRIFGPIPISLCNAWPCDPYFSYSIALAGSLLLRVDDNNLMVRRCSTISYQLNVVLPIFRRQGKTAGFQRLRVRLQECRFGAFVASGGDKGCFRETITG